MEIKTLLNGVVATGAGSALRLDEFRCKDGPIPFVVSGISTATVVIQGAIATDDEVTAGTAAWETITDKSFTADCCNEITAAYTHIRANVTVYTGGTIYVKALV